jgi:hypothetical protein
MKMNALFGAAMTLLAATALAQTAKPNPREFNPASLTYVGEKHLKNVRQLTYGADNAEA